MGANFSDKLEAARLARERGASVEQPTLSDFASAAGSKNWATSRHARYFDESQRLDA